MTDAKFDPKTTTAAEVQRINQSLITDGLVTPDHYYLDLMLLKDIRVGMVIAAIYNRPEGERQSLYDELTKLLSVYQARSFDDDEGLVKHPCYKEGKALLEDPATQARVFLVSPMTPLRETIDAHLVINANHSQLREKFEKVRVSKTTYRKNWDAITFHVNTYPFPAEGEVAKLAAAFIVDRYGVNVELIYHAPKEIPKKVFLECDEFFVYCNDAFLESPEVQEELKPLINIKKIFYITPIFMADKKKKWTPERLKPERMSLKAYLDMFITFEWMPTKAYCVYPKSVPSMDRFI